MIINWILVKSVLWRDGKLTWRNLIQSRDCYKENKAHMVMIKGILVKSVLWRDGRLTWPNLIQSGDYWKVFQIPN